MDQDQLLNQQHQVKQIGLFPPLLMISIFRNSTPWNSIKTFTTPLNFSLFFSFFRPGIPLKLPLPPGIYHCFFLFSPWNSIKTFTTPWNFPLFFTFLPPWNSIKTFTNPWIFQYFFSNPLEFHKNSYHPLEFCY